MIVRVSENSLFKLGMQFKSRAVAVNDSIPLSTWK